MVGWVYHDDFLKHDTGVGHPERADRLRSVHEALREADFAASLKTITPKPIDPQRLHRIHDADYVQRIAALMHEAPTYADSGDTPVSKDSYAVALLATGGAVAAADAVMDGQFKRAFCSHRPPGHHAERNRAMGFCLFNHVAVAADHLVHHHKLERVAIVDFDVHHGNGTQHSFEDRADVLFVSIHQDPRTLYPGTGFAHEIGRGAGEGFTLNVPMPPHSGDDDYAEAFEQKILPKLRDYRPQVLLVSAGFDAMAEDPLARIDLTERAFSQMTRSLVEIADEFCDGRLISVLEGGYDLQALARATVAHVQELIGEE